MTSFLKNIVTDFNAPTDGTSDVSPAWNSFTAFLQGLNAGDDVTLEVPAHRYMFKGVSAVDIAPGILGGITLVINATDAIFDGNTGGGFFLNANGIIEDNVHSSRIVSVNVGSVSVTLVTPSEHTRFSVDQYIAVTGIDLQGFGSPPNPGFYEYHKITAINTGSGLISISGALDNQYLSTWPLYSGGSGSSLDLGGPATIYAMPAKWDIDVTFNGVTIDQIVAPAGATFFKGRKAMFNGGGTVGISQISPTVNQSIIFNNFEQPDVDVIEVDKMVEELVYDGVTLNQIQFQSVAGTDTTVTDSAITTYNGTPKNLTIAGGTTDSLQVGVIGQGRTDSLSVSGCVVSAISVNPVSEQDVMAKFTISNGVISSQDSLNGAIRWAMPGTYMIFAGQYTFEGSPFRITDVTQDGGFTRIHTTLQGGWPTLPLRSGALDLRVHPCPNASFVSCVGSADAIDLSGIMSGPLWDHSNRTYTKATPQVTVPVWGSLVRITINVVTPYAGAQSPTFSFDPTLGLGMFVINSSGSDVRWNPTVNPKISGVRNLFPTTHNGAQSGDSLPDPGAGTWLLNNQIVPGFSTNMSDGDATVTIEIVTNQGIFNGGILILGRAL